MVRSFRICAALLALPVLLAIAQPASAQMMLPPLYNPPNGYYAPRVSYYAPPVVSYYSAPTVSYYGNPGVTYYSAPVTTYYAPAPAATTYYRYGLFGRRVMATTYYGP